MCLGLEGGGRGWGEGGCGDLVVVVMVVVLMMTTVMVIEMIGIFYARAAGFLHSGELFSLSIAAAAAAEVFRSPFWTYMHANGSNLGPAERISLSTPTNYPTCASTTSCLAKTSARYSLVNCFSSNTNTGGLLTYMNPCKQVSTP